MGLWGGAFFKRNSVQFTVSHPGSLHGGLPSSKVPTGARAMSKNLPGFSLSRPTGGPVCYGRASFCRAEGQTMLKVASLDELSNGSLWTTVRVADGQVYWSGLAMRRCHSPGETSSTWVATFHRWPKGSISKPERSP